MIVSLLITVEGSKPEMSRLLNVEDSTNLGELANIIEAAFGFSGMATHMYMDSTGPTRHVYAPQPSLGEIAEDSVTVAEIGPTTYVYDSGANWNLAIVPLGQSDIDGPTPLLVDALGPDVVEASGGPSMMTRFHHEARRLSAGLVPDMEVAPLLLSFLPVMSPERILQRLSVADHVSVSERISYVAEEMQLNAASRAPEDSRAPQLANEFEHFLEQRPDLQQIMSLDPRPEHNPTLVAAIAEFFSENLADQDDYDDGFDVMQHNLSVLLDYAAEGLPLTDAGELREGDARIIGEEIGLSPLASARPVDALREALTATKVLESQGGILTLSKLGHSLIDDIPTLVTHLVDKLPQAFPAAEWPSVLMWLTSFSGAHPGQAPTLSDPERALDVFVGMGVLSPEPGNSMTTSGQRFLAQLLDRHANEV
ncbi:IS1096 element passenger TnpR family protein [Corynebacterium sp. S7]